MQRIPHRVHPSLHSFRDVQPHQRIKIRAHDGNQQPSQRSAHAPRRQIPPKREQEVFRAHRDEQTAAHHPHAAFRRGEQDSEQAADQRRQRGHGGEDAHGILPAPAPREQQRRQRGFVHGRDEVNRREVQHERQQSGRLSEEPQPLPGRIKEGFVRTASLPLRNTDEAQQRRERDGECRQIREHDRSQTAERHQRHCKRGRKQSGQAGREIPQSTDPLVLRFRQQRGRCGFAGGLLERVHQAVQRVKEIQVRDLQPPRLQQDERRDGCARGKRIADEHRPARIEAVNQRAAEQAEYNIRRVAADRQQRGGQRRPALLIRPDNKRVAGHGAAERRKRLRREQQEEMAQFAQRFKKRMQFHMALLLHADNPHGWNAIFR